MFLLIFVKVRLMMKAPGPSNELFRLDPEALEWTDFSAGVVQGNPPAPRFYHGASAAAGCLFIFAGENDVGTDE